MHNGTRWNSRILIFVYKIKTYAFPIEMSILIDVHSIGLYLTSTPHLICIRGPTEKMWVSDKILVEKFQRTLSQSIFWRVNGRARLSPLNVFSDISWYTLLRTDWYFFSSFSINASILSEACFGGVVEVIAGGRENEGSWVVASWTCSFVNKSDYICIR